MVDGTEGCVSCVSPCLHVYIPLYVGIHTWCCNCGWAGPPAAGARVEFERKGGRRESNSSTVSPVGISAGFNCSAGRRVGTPTTTVNTRNTHTHSLSYSSSHCSLLPLLLTPITRNLYARCQQRTLQVQLMKAGCDYQPRLIIENHLPSP